MASAAKHRQRSRYSYRINRMNAPFASFERRATEKVTHKEMKKSLASIASIAKGFFKKVFAKKGDK